ncbi:MAG: hypothetical protein JW816_02840 [Candidatus Buchananbacteria bacterium]|nr:hypothetical protein [Candidatus Buchananbacteria bacterium]
MAQIGKKNSDADVLSEIYDDYSEVSRVGFAARLKIFFSDPKKNSIFLNRAILLVGLFAVVFSVLHFRNLVFAPYISHQQQAGKLEITLNQDASSQDLLGLAQKDTDSDGLSDFDELNVYHTSPYLTDSDSDGYTDKQEIARGSDPNCVEGKDCFALSDIQSGVIQQAAVPQLTTGVPSGLPTDVSVDQIRQILLDAGLTHDYLDILSDQDVLNLYQQALNTPTDNSAIQTNSYAVDQDVGNNPGLTKEDIALMSPSEIRDLLKQNAGLTDEQLNNISDADLLDFVSQTLKDF